MLFDPTRLPFRAWWGRFRGVLLQRPRRRRPAPPRSAIRAVTPDRRFLKRPRFPALGIPGAARVTPPIAYRTYRPGDEHSVMQGFNRAFGLDRDATYWRWKFCGPGEPMVMLAVDAGGVVQAQFAGVRLEWAMDGMRVPVAQICDVFARRHPCVIRENVMLRTMEAFHEAYAEAREVSLVFGFPNPTALKLHSTLRPSYESTRPVATYRRVIDSPPVADAGRASKTVPSREAVDALWNRAAPRYGCATPRDSGWFQWRFQDRPDVTDYVPMSCFRRDGTLAAWLVLRRDADTLWICDLVWDGASSADLETLDEAVMRETMRLGLRENGAWLQGDNLAAQALLGRGWLDASAEQTIHPAIHVYDPAVDAAEIYSCLYLTLADSDLI